MSNSTTLLDTITTAQAQKEVTANAMFDAASQAMVFGRRASTTTALTWGYYGGAIWLDGVLTAIANGTVALTASNTNYVERTRAGVVSKNVTGFTAGQIPLYEVVTGVSTITSYTDRRIHSPQFTGWLSKSVAGSSNVTLTAAEARNNILTFTGALTGSINVIVPADAQQWTVFNNTSGSFTLTVKTSGGTGIAVAQGKKTILHADGTNVVASFDSVALASSYAVGDLFYADTTSSIARLADVAAGSYLRSGGVNTAPLWSTATLPNTATVGDVIYASASNVYSNLAGVATGNVLISGGVATAPSWGKVGLTTHVSGTLPVANGGTGVTSSTGSGSTVLSASPTFTGTLGCAAITPTGLIDISGASAGQVKFPATQNPSADANTLDAYEEGTFTPVMTFGGGSTGITYSAQVGNYTKIGNLVIIFVGLVFTSKGSSTGTVSVTGMPFTSKNVTQLRPEAFLRMNNMTAGTAGVGYGLILENTSSVIFQNYSSITGVTATLADTDYTNTTINQLALPYYTA